MGAGLRQNLGADWDPQVWTSLTDYYPNKVYTNVAGRCAERVKKDRERKNTEAAKEKRRRSKYAPTDDTAQLAVLIADTMVVLHLKKLLMTFPQNS